ncbi:hypothetical protein ACFQVA_06535 [Actinomadura keratinilytica]
MVRGRRGRALLTLTGPGAPWHSALTFLFLAAAPGGAVALALAGLDPWTRAVAALGTALAVNTLVAQALLMLGAWSARTGVVAVGAAAGWSSPGCSPGGSPGAAASREGGSADVDITVHRPGELTAADRAAWSALQRARPPAEAPQLHNPFLAPEFTLAMGACRRDVRIAVVREDGVPAAFFPHQRTPAGVGRAVGLGVSDCQGLVHGPGFTGDAGELLRGAGLAVWEFDHLAADQPLFAGGAGTRFGSPVMDVADGWESYLAGLRERSPKFTRTTLAKERRSTATWARCGTSTTSATPRCCAS